LTIICTPFSSPLCEVAFDNFLLKNFMMMMMMMMMIGVFGVCELTAWCIITDRVSREGKVSVRSSVYIC